MSPRESSILKTLPLFYFLNRKRENVGNTTLLGKLLLLLLLIPTFPLTLGLCFVGNAAKTRLQNSYSLCSHCKRQEPALGEEHLLPVQGERAQSSC